jgi:ATP-dependent Clp protease ATP-binding subunit ClpC
MLTAGTLFDGERERLLASLLSEVSASRDIVLAMEHLEQAVSSVPRGPLLLAQALDCGARLMGTSTPANLRWFDQPPLARRLRPVEVIEMSPEETVDVLSALRMRFEDYHRIKINGLFLAVVVQRAASLTGWYPCKAIALLDAAAARARLAAISEMRIEDIYLAAANFLEGT